MVAKHSTDTTKFAVPRRVIFTPSRTGLANGVASTFGSASALIQDSQTEFVYNPFKTVDIDDAIREKWKDFICDQFPRRNGDRIGRVEGETRFGNLGIIPVVGSELRWTLAKDEWSLRQVSETVAEMGSSFALEGSVNTAGLLEPLDAAPHGACSWLKLHYGTSPFLQWCFLSAGSEESFIGHALLFLAYEEYSPDDTVVPSELFAGDVMLVWVALLKARVD